MEKIAQIACRRKNSVSSQCGFLSAGVKMGLPENLMAEET